MNRGWDIVAANAGAARFFGHLLDGRPMPSPANVVRMMFDTAWLRPFVAEWDVVAESLVRRVYREAVGAIADDATSRLLEEVLGYPGVPERWSRPDPDVPLLPVIPVAFTRNAQTYTFFSAVTTLGTPQDVTLQELRIECFFPLTAETERNVAALADVADR